MMLEDLTVFFGVSGVIAFGLYGVLGLLVICLAPREINLKFCGVDKAGVAGLYWLTSKYGFMQKTTYVSFGIFFPRFAKRYHVEGMNEVTPRWYRRLCLVFLIFGFFNFTLSFLLALTFMLLSAL